MQTGRQMISLGCKGPAIQAPRRIINRPVKQTLVAQKTQPLGRQQLNVECRKYIKRSRVGKINKGVMGRFLINKKTGEMWARHAGLKKKTGEKTYERKQRLKKWFKLSKPDRRRMMVMLGKHKTQFKPLYPKGIQAVQRMVKKRMTENYVRNTVVNRMKLRPDAHNLMIARAHRNWWVKVGLLKGYEEFLTNPGTWKTLEEKESDELPSNSTLHIKARVPKIHNPYMKKVILREIYPHTGSKPKSASYVTPIL